MVVDKFYNVLLAVVFNNVSVVYRVSVSSNELGSSFYFRGKIVCGSSSDKGPTVANWGESQGCQGVRGSVG